MPVKKSTAPAPEAKPAETPASAAPAQPAAAAVPVKKSNTALIVILIVVLLLFVLPGIAIFGLGWFAKNKIKDAAKNGINLGNGQVSVNPTDNQKWPDSMPSIVPKFTKGTITSSTRLGDYWSVIASNVTLADYTAYKTTLTGAGYTFGEEGEFGTGLKTITATKGGYSVALTYTAGDDGTSLMIIVQKEETPTTTE